jgi:hypothetical protein
MAIAAQIAVAQIVSQEKEDVRGGGILGGGRIVLHEDRQFSDRAHQ